LENYTDWKTAPFGEGKSSEPGIKMFNRNGFDTLPDTCCSNSDYCSINSSYIRSQGCLRLLGNQINSAVRESVTVSAVIVGINALLGLATLLFYIKMWRNYQASLIKERTDEESKENSVEEQLLNNFDNSSNMEVVSSSSLGRPRLFLVYTHVPHISPSVYQKENETQIVQEHREKVRHLADLLRDEWGIEVMCDSYVECHEPPTNWPQWMDEQITQADFVGIVWSKSMQGHLRQREMSWPKSGQGFRYEMKGVLEAVRSKRRASTSYPHVIIIQLEEDLRSVPRVLACDPLFVLESQWPLKDDESLRNLARYLLEKKDPPPSAVERRGQKNYVCLPEGNREQRDVKNYFAPEGIGRAEIVINEAEENSIAQHRLLTRMNIVLILLILVFWIVPFHMAYYLGLELQGLTLLCAIDISKIMESRLAYSGVIILWTIVLTLFVVAIMKIRGRQVWCWFGRHTRPTAVPRLLAIVLALAAFGLVVLPVVLYIGVSANTADLQNQSACMIEKGMTLYGNNSQRLLSKAAYKLIPKFQDENDCCGVHNFTEWAETPFGAGNSTVPELMHYNHVEFGVLPKSCCRSGNFCAANSSDVHQNGCLLKLAKKINKDIQAVCIAFGILGGFALFGSIGLALIYMRLWKSYKREMKDICKAVFEGDDTEHVDDCERTDMQAQLLVNY
jgi:hypothetical protein